MFRFPLPDPGEGLVEADITRWLVKVGDVVKVNDPIIEVETAKSLVELPSPVDGTIHRLLVEVGQSVEVGTPIVEIDDGSGDAGRPDGDEQAETGATDEKPEPMLVGYGPSASPTSRRRRRGGRPATPNGTSAQRSAEPAGVRSTSADPAEGTSAGYAAAHPTPAEGPAPRSDAASAPASPARPTDDLAPRVAGAAPAPERTPGQSSPQATAPDVHVRSAPVVRRLARDLGLDLHAIHGTGPEGIVTRDDVVQAAGGPAGDADDLAPMLGERAVPDRLEPIRGVRKATANNLVASLQEHVHATIWTTFDITASMDFIEALKKRREFRDIRVSIFMLVANAVRQVLPRYPTLNASWMEDDGQIGYHDHINLGFAAATPRGLMVPNVKHAEELDLRGLAKRINELIVEAREGRLSMQDMSHGTFTITNVGVFGVDSGTAVINGHESAILCLGAVERRPWVVGEGPMERIEPRWVTTMSLSIDHRLIDGEQGANFLREVTGLLGQPGLGSLY